MNIMNFDSFNESRNEPMGLSKDETLKIAEKLAKAITAIDDKEVNVNLETLEEDSFDLDFPNDEYGAGSYTIDSDGNITNHALPENPIYGNVSDTVEQMVTKMEGK
jgi:hypothetical protein